MMDYPLGHGPPGLITPPHHHGPVHGLPEYGREAVALKPGSHHDHRTPASVIVYLAAGNLEPLHPRTMTAVSQKDLGPELDDGRHNPRPQRSRHAAHRASWHQEVQPAAHPDPRRLPSTTNSCRWMTGSGAQTAGQMTVR
jgi:hypothetical protein